MFLHNIRGRKIRIMEGVRLGPARPVPARLQLGSARLGSGRPGSVRLARLGSARLGPARLGSSRLVLARLGSARLAILNFSHFVREHLLNRTVTYPKRIRVHSFRRKTHSARGGIVNYVLGSINQTVRLLVHRNLTNEVRMTLLHQALQGNGKSF